MVGVCADAAIASNVSSAIANAGNPEVPGRFIFNFRTVPSLYLQFWLFLRRAEWNYESTHGACRFCKNVGNGVPPVAPEAGISSSRSVARPGFLESFCTKYPVVGSGGCPFGTNNSG